jgi:hypothetical protein
MTTVMVKPWSDPILDVLGHDPRSWYVETFRPFPPLACRSPRWCRTRHAGHDRRCGSIHAAAQI